MAEGLQGLLAHLAGSAIGPSETQSLLQQLADQDPEAADKMMDRLGYGHRPARRTLGEGAGLYWDARHPTQGGTQRVESSVGAPSADHYRLVDSMEEGHDVLGRGEKPLLIGNLEDINPDEIDPRVLRQLQEDQWAAPGGTPLWGDMGTSGGLQGLLRQ